MHMQLKKPPSHIKVAGQDSDLLICNGPQILDSLSIN